MFNCTDLVIPNYANIILGLNGNFGLTYNHGRAPIIRTIASIEANIRRNDVISFHEAKLIRTEMTNIVTNYLYKQKLTIFERFVSLYVRKTRSFLKDNDDIIVDRSDKGNKTVILTKDMYENKMMELIDDAETYKPLTRDPTLRIPSKMNKIITTWLASEYIDDITASRWKRQNSVHPGIYGLPKIHKAGLPFRPIISNINTATS